MSGKKLLWALVLVAGIGAFGLSGCVVRPYPGRRAVVAYDYQPMLYNGYVVYYDRGGQPYYYSGSARYWVPRAYWGRYRTHYYNHQSYYWRWYRSRGRTYRGRRYRRGYFRRGRYSRRGRVRRRGHVRHRRRYHY